MKTLAEEGYAPR